MPVMYMSVIISQDFKNRSKVTSHAFVDKEIESFAKHYTM